MADGAAALVRVESLTKLYPLKARPLSRSRLWLRAVDGISFDIRRGETLGLVGESGCGKTTTGKLLLRLLRPTSGRVFFDGEDLMGMSPSRLRRLRRDMQIVFQDPYGSLNPRMRVEELVAEPLRTHRVAPEKEIREIVEPTLDSVGLTASSLRKYPHEFSGGQRQRIAIARAMALKPRFVVCDEPVSALDVSIRAEILNLLRKLQRDMHTTYLFISHDLAVVRHLCDRIAVMYLGKIVEMAPWDKLFSSPAHPYTKALLSAIPVPDPRCRRKRIILEGDAPSPVGPFKGCRFSSRCWQRMPQCEVSEPGAVQVSEGHWAACFRANESGGA